MKPVIEVNNISKSYIIGHQKDGSASYDTLKDDFAKLIKKPFGGSGKETFETFWALKDVSFKVNAGEAFGIVGRNGSGKSTLLKILSRIVDPTSGKAILHGRTASLLEVGTGFHPELTGRENIFFNGSMLGMSKQEIAHKFNEIVEFSEVERFIDTPVKFYSSGMYVRLAFSVAAHLESEVLILDEVLSVGDAAFQKKSLNKILSSIDEGRTVMFVSHSMPSVQQICNRGLLLKNGHIDYIGAVDELAAHYTAQLMEYGYEDDVNAVWSNDGSIDNEYFVPQKIYMETEEGEKVTKAIKNDKSHNLVIKANIKKESELLTIGIALYSGETRSLMFMSYPSDMKKWRGFERGLCTLRVKIPKHFLNSGKYKVSLIGGIHNQFWLFEPGTTTPSMEFVINGGLSESKFWQHPREGSLAPLLDWEVKDRGK